MLKVGLSNRAEGYRDLGQSLASTRGLMLFSHICNSGDINQRLKVRKITRVSITKLWVKWKLKQDETPSIGADLCMTGDKDVVGLSPDFPMWGPQQCPHPAVDRSLPGRLYSHVPLSSLSPAC